MTRVSSFHTGCVNSRVSSFHTRHLNSQSHFTLNACDCECEITHHIQYAYTTYSAMYFMFLTGCCLILQAGFILEQHGVDFHRAWYKNQYDVINLISKFYFAKTPLVIANSLSHHNYNVSHTKPKHTGN